MPISSLNTIANSDIQVINGLFLDSSNNQPPEISLAKKLNQQVKNHNQLLVNFLIENPEKIEEVVVKKVEIIDHMLIRIWSNFFDESTPLCLVAVGGYGRRELFPHSDIDLLILTEASIDEETTSKLELFITFLWDIGLDIGSSVRSIDQCIEEATKDATVITNLIESYPLCGQSHMMAELDEKITVDKIWSISEFFEAKSEEQNKRYSRYNESTYRLEPNLKESRGGLRDIQTISWVAKRGFQVNSLNEIINIGFIQQDECQALIEGRNFLWLIRFLLHGLAQRKEDRILFNYQNTLAEQIGYTGKRVNDKIEQLMQRYYRTITELSRLNEMLLQLFREEIVFKHHEQSISRINNRFQVRNGYLEARSNELFHLYPPAIMELFVILSSHDEIIGVRADTIRQIRNNLDEINEEFRNDTISNALFVQLFRLPQGITHQLRRMARYGVLARYIPAYAKVAGRMQYDLFHVYTVDEHTLAVIRNLRRLDVTKHDNEFPLASEIMHKLPKSELLYLAGLFHDIAKGRDGDHSQLGAEDAEVFCKQHGLSRVDTKLVVWLVANHLNMSMTAQKKDLSDPEVIFQFAKQVGSIHYLQNLYLLTMCDMRATNPDAWSDWKDRLLKDLYKKTLKVLRNGLDNPLDIEEEVAEKRSFCLDKLLGMGLPSDRVNRLWNTFRKGYFIRYSTDEIILHSEAILLNEEVKPIVLFYPNAKAHCSNLFIYTENTDLLFALITNTLDKMQLSILDSRIIISKDNNSLFSFSVLNNQLKPVEDQTSIDYIRQTLFSDLSNPCLPEPLSIKKQYRTHQFFDPKVLVNFSHWQEYTVLNVNATDAPGVLSVITRELYRQKIRVHNAKVGTVGERIDDIFFVTDQNNKCLNDAFKQQLGDALEKTLHTYYEEINPQ